jgi:hypothetical protein
MATIMAFDHKAVWLVRDALASAIAAHEIRALTMPLEDDAEHDFGNDLAYLKILHAEFAHTASAGNGTAHVYQCWADPEDSSLSLLQLQKVSEHRALGMLSDRATMLYEFAAATGEEAMAIHCLRQGWAPYLPMGEAAPCPACAASYFPLGYGDCWRCGHIG